MMQCQDIHDQELYGCGCISRTVKAGMEALERLKRLPISALSKVNSYQQQEFLLAIGIPSLRREKDLPGPVACFRNVPDCQPVLHSGCGYRACVDGKSLLLDQ